jgi:hypothetical protein
MSQPRVHVPLLQMLAPPGPQCVPSGAGVNAVVVAAGVQSSQAFMASAAPDAKNAPPMKQPGVQVPALQTWPPPQLVPVASGVKLVVLIVGWQVWQALLGSTAAGS